MKIYWIVSNYPHLHDVQAGIFYRIFAEELVKAGVDLTIIAPTPYTGAVLAAISPTWKKYHLSPEKEEVNGVKIYRPRYLTHPQEVYRGIPHRFILRAIRKLNLAKPDLIHGFGAYPASYAAVEFAAQLDVPAVTTFIGSDVNEFPFHSARSMSRFLHTVSRSTKLFAVGEMLAKKVEVIAKVKPDVMYMPVRKLANTPLSKDLARKTLGLPDSTFLLLFVGYISEAKGIVELCTALQQRENQKDITCVFVGKESHLSVKYAKLTNAIWRGQMEQTEVLNYMNAADLLVLPSHNEGIPGVIKEAGQMNLPTLASNVGGIPELLGNERGYMIEPKNSALLLEEIVKIKNNYDDAKLRAQRLHEFVNAEFDAATVVKKQIAEYQKLIQHQSN